MLLNFFENKYRKPKERSDLLKSNKIFIIPKTINHLVLITLIIKTLSLDMEGINMMVDFLILLKE